MKIKKKRNTGSDKVFMQNSIKTLVANIRFASVDKPISTITVTSAIPNEGKTSIAVALAGALAASGKDVLIVECDMRRRSLSGALGVHPRTGMYSVLSGQDDLNDAVVETSTRGLYFLDSEPHIPNPVDILASRRFSQLLKRLREDYDYVVFDTPPLSTFVDAAVIGSVTDGTLIVAREDYVKRDDLIAAYDQLQKAEANVLGVVMNFCQNERNEYYYSYYSKDGARPQPIDLSDEKTVGAGAATPTVPVAPPERRNPVQAHAARPVQAVDAADDDADDTGSSRPTGAGISPDTTAEFLAASGYHARSSYDDE